MAMAEGARLARAMGARLEVVHAAADPPAVDAARLMAQAPPHLSPIEPTVISDGGHAAAAICAWAAEEDVEVLVASPHQGALARLLLGSFASYLVHHAPCQVLIARPTARADAAEPPRPTDPNGGDRSLEPLVEPIEPLLTQQTLREAAARIQEEGCPLPVVDDIGRLVGVIGTADILGAMLPQYLPQIRRTEVLARDLPSLRRRARRALAGSVEDYMRTPVAVRPEDSEAHAASLLAREGVEALPVVRSWSQLAGVLRASALCRDLSRGDLETPAAVPSHAREMPEMDDFRHIACCVDESPATLEALATAARVRGAGTTAFTVVHAVGSPAAGESESEARRLLDDAARKTGAQTALVYGHPPVAIARWAAEEAVDLLVAASHRGGVSRVALGSFARHLAHRAPCSVLFTRPRPDRPRIA